MEQYIKLIRIEALFEVAQKAISPLMPHDNEVTDLRITALTLNITSF
jgi:hypothetical protein